MFILVCGNAVYLSDGVFVPKEYLLFCILTAVVNINMFNTRIDCFIFEIFKV